VLRSCLDNIIALPYNALVYQDTLCCNAAHTADLNNFAREITDSCVNAADCTLPTIRKHGSRGFQRL